MKDWALELDRQLQEMARRRPRGSVRRTWVGTTALAGAAGAAAVLAALAVHSPQRASAFAVLDEPATDARSLHDIVPLLVRNGADLRHARAIATPSGTGYVVSADGGRRLCLAVPDRVDGYGEGCEPTARARRDGLFQYLAGPRSAEFVAVLPRDGRASGAALSHRDGVITATVERPTRITLTVAGKTTTVPVAPMGRCVAAGAPLNDAHAHARRLRCTFA
ncbi:MAG TPA: hypothetical protein VHX88_14225 [Solirubrobacteraceae bacterium]|jgi:hypothetical protein|nr:hypothetical protein [Solirubrobacteraceae bacterium]